MLIDLHAHTKGISWCCKEEAEEIIKTAVSCGYDGLAISNHYADFYYNDENYDDWIEKYIAEWSLCEELGKKYNIKIFKAIEVTMCYDDRVHILIYGADDEFLRKHPKLCRNSLSELFTICNENDCALIQAHPFRNGSTIQDVNFLHGLEINCHPAYLESRADEILRKAEENGLAVTVGCDYHADSYRPCGGTYIPNEIKADKELASYILTSKEFELKIHEPNTEKPYEKVYKR